MQIHQKNNKKSLPTYQSASRYSSESINAKPINGGSKYLHASSSLFMPFRTVSLYFCNFFCNYFAYIAHENGMSVDKTLKKYQREE